jgi:hypothetical protein
MLDLLQKFMNDNASILNQAGHQGWSITLNMLYLKFGAVIWKQAGERR